MTTCPQGHEYTPGDGCRRCQVMRKFGMIAPTYGAKHCNGCDRDLQLSSFSRSLAMSDGHQSRCKECRQRDARQTTYVRPSRTCAKCGAFGPVIKDVCVRCYDNARHLEKRRLGPDIPIERVRAPVVPTPRTESYRAYCMNCGWDGYKPEEWSLRACPRCSGRVWLEPDVGVRAGAA